MFFGTILTFDVHITFSVLNDELIIKDGGLSGLRAVYMVTAGAFSQVADWWLRRII